MNADDAHVRRINNYRDLVAWQKAMQLAEWACRAAFAFKGSVGVRLAGEIAKTAISIPSNIAEGHELQTASFRQHLRIALASLAELRTQLELAARLQLLDAARWESEQGAFEELERVTRSLRAALGRRLSAARGSRPRRPLNP